MRGVVTNASRLSSYFNLLKKKILPVTLCSYFYSIAPTLRGGNNNKSKGGVRGRGTCVPGILNCLKSFRKK